MNNTTIKSNDKHASLDRWMRAVNFPNLKSFLREDYNKRSRLQLLNKLTKIRYESADQINASDTNDKQLLNYFSKQNTKLFSFRLIPRNISLPKFRTEKITATKNNIQKMFQ